MVPHMDMKMNGSKQHAVLGLLLLVLSLGYTSGGTMSGSRLSSSSMLAAQQGQENVTQDTVAQETVPLECDEEGASLTVDCNFCYCLNGQFSCSNKICATNSESKGPLETDIESPHNSTNAYEGLLETDNKSPHNSTNAYEDPEYEEDPECVEGTRWTKEYPDECNICECSFGQAICTMKNCLPECVHGTFWVDGCNTCECYEGEATCTTRKCFSATTCVEGSSWTEDCNTCFCSNGIVSCTKKICPTKGDVTSTQLPETTTRKRCNGTYAGCSVMGGADFRGEGRSLTLTTKITMLSEVGFCKFIKNGQLEHFPFIEKCYKAGKLACAYCENEALPKYNSRTCKCHKKSRFTGRK